MCSFVDRRNGFKIRGGKISWASRPNTYQRTACCALNILATDPISAAQSEISAPGLSLQEINIVTYIGGYIVRRIRDVCEECRPKVSSSICLEDPKHAFLSIKNYSGTKEGLLAPSTSLVQLLILHLMINIRLHHTIKRNNLMLRDETTRKNRKTQI